MQWSELMVINTIFSIFPYIKYPLKFLCSEITNLNNLLIILLDIFQLSACMHTLHNFTYGIILDYFSKLYLMRHLHLIKNFLNPYKLLSSWKENKLNFRGLLLPSRSICFSFINPKLLERFSFSWAENFHLITYIH